MLASGVMALYHHVKGDWTPVKGDAKSNISLVKGKAGSYNIKVVLISNNEVRFFHLRVHFILRAGPKLTCSFQRLLSSVLTKSNSIQLQAGYETFYLYFDGKVYWGFWFSDATVASIFSEKVVAALKSLSSEPARANNSTPTSTSATSKLKSPKTPGARSEDSSIPTRSGSAPGAKQTSTPVADSSTASRSFTQPSKINSTVSEAVLSKPSTPTSTAKMTSTVSEAVLGSKSGFSPASSSANGSKDSSSASTIGKLQRPGVSTPPSSSGLSASHAPAPGSAPHSSHSSSSGAASTPGTPPVISGLKKLDMSAASASSAPSSPGRHSADDATLQSSPSSKSLKRPDSSRKRSTTTLTASGDSHIPESVEEKKSKSQREKIIDEVLKTEEDYVDSLSLVREKYLIPLKYAPRLGISIFKPGDLEKIMYGIEPIFVLNTALLGDLKLRKHDKTIYDQCGSILHRYAPSMKLYIGTTAKPLFSHFTLILSPPLTPLLSHL